MGCDAHPCIEIRRDGEWEFHDSKDRYWELMDDPANGITYENIRKKRGHIINFFGERYYVLFSVLADVRNYGDSLITPLFKERGIPYDAADRTAAELNGDLHSHTYFTVRELLDVDWDSTACHELCALYPDDYAEWKETGEFPSVLESDDMAGSTYRRGMRTDQHREVSDDEMVMLLLASDPKDLFTSLSTEALGTVKSGPYVVKKAPLSYRGLVPDLLNIIPLLQELGNPDDVRIVIAFDN